jgi:hypothetical protein
MGSPIAQVASSTQPLGKGPASNAANGAAGMDAPSTPAFAPAVQGGQPQGKGGSSMGAQVVQDMRYRGEEVARKPNDIAPIGKGGGVTSPPQGGQPRMGMPNNYSNTVGQWDNSSIQPAQMRSGKGKELNHGRR